MTSQRADNAAELPDQSLFRQLLTLHRRAGEPSTRDIARRTHGAVSHSTVNAILRGTRFPKWGHLEVIVEALEGDTAHFRELWVQARDAEDRDDTTLESGGSSRTSLVGRQRELDQIQAAISQLASGRGRALLVEGEPGIGKSALVQAATAGANADGAQVFWGTCDELSSAFPLQPLLDAFSSAGAPHATIMELVRGEAAADNRPDPIAVAAGQLLAHVHARCTAAPTILVIDDLQWADPMTVAALRRLTRWLSELPLLLVGIVRPVPRRLDLGALRRTVGPNALLRLSGLADAEVAELVERVIGGRPGPRLLGLAAEAAGNPLYVFELLDALKRSGGLTAENDRIEAVSAEAPRSLATAIRDRLGFLRDEVQHILRAASLLGSTFSAAELSLVTGLRIEALVRILDEAILAGALRDGRSGLAFRHPLIRAAIYDGIPDSARDAWHSTAARRLARHGAPPELVVRQLLQVRTESGNRLPGWVAGWLADMGSQLVSRAPQAAASLLHTVVNELSPGIGPRDELICRLADALYRTGSVQQAAMVATDALSHVTRPRLRVDLLRTLTQCQGTNGQSEQSVAKLELVLGSTEAIRADRAHLLVLDARARRMRGHLAEAEQAANDALAIADAEGDRSAKCWALAVLALIQGMRGQETHGLAQSDRALILARGDPDLVDLKLMIQINQANMLGDLDRHHEAIETARKARKHAATTGNTIRRAQAHSMLSELYFDIGQWDEALTEAAKVPTGAEQPYVECVTRSLACIIRLHRGDAEAGQNLLDAERCAARLDRGFSLLTLAQSLDRERTHAPKDALALLVDGLAKVAAELEQAIDLLPDAVRLALEAHDVPRAQEFVHQAEAIVGRSPVPHRQAVTLHCRGLLNHNPQTLASAATQYDRAGRRLLQAQALEAAGVAALDNGNTAEARTYLATASSLYAALGASRDLARMAALSVTGFGDAA